MYRISFFILFGFFLIFSESLLADEKEKKEIIRKQIQVIITPDGAKVLDPQTGKEVLGGVRFFQPGKEQGEELERTLDRLRKEVEELKRALGKGDPDFKPKGVKPPLFEKEKKPGAIEKEFPRHDDRLGHLEKMMERLLQEMIELRRDVKSLKDSLPGPGKKGPFPPKGFTPPKPGTPPKPPQPPQSREEQELRQKVLELLEQLHRLEKREVENLRREFPRLP